MGKAVALMAVVILGVVLVVIAGPPWEGPMQAFTAHYAQSAPDSWGGSEVDAFERNLLGPQVKIGVTKTAVWLLVFAVVVWMGVANIRKKGKTPR